jgi:hypothetical protein
MSDLFRSEGDERVAVGGARRADPREHESLRGTRSSDGLVAANVARTSPHPSLGGPLEPTSAVDERRSPSATVPSSRDIDVVFIGGASRTGSTLLSLLLGSLPGYFAAGEVRYVWLRGLRANQLCECGEPFRSCTLWRRVVSAGLGQVDRAAADDLAALWNTTASFLPVLRPIPWMREGSREARRRYLEHLRRFFVALRDVTQARFIVDASKYATDAMLLGELPGVRVHTLHLIRDSRAVAHSWTRKKQRPEIHWRKQDMELMSPAKSALHWASMNAAMEAVGSRIGAYHRIRYEDLVMDPVGSLVSVLPENARPALEAVFAGGEIRRVRGHSFSGNPVRFEAEPLRIRPDDEWLRAMGERDFRFVTTMTLPLLLRYGYPVTRDGWSRAFSIAPPGEGRRPADV